MDIVEPLMGVAHYRDDVAIEPETVSVRFAEGWPVAINGDELPSQLELVMEANAIGGRHGSACRIRSRTGSSRPRAAGIYEAPWARALAHRVRAARVRHPQREHDRELPHDGPPPRAAVVRGALVRSAEPHAARAADALGRVGDHG
jgi:hypothetical protein